MASSQEPKSLCVKRKLVNDCLSKECKSRRVQVENGPSSDPSAKQCKCCCTRPNLAGDCVNYLKRGVSSRIMFYKQGSWQSFPEVIMKSLVLEFKGSKSSVVAVMDDEPVLVDFLSMTLVNLKTRKQRSVAWFDDSGKGFFPSMFFDEEADGVYSGNVDDIEEGIMLDKPSNSQPEVVKQVVIESSSPIPQKPSTADVLRKKITSVERGSKDFLFVRDLFLSGMGSFATENSILHIHRYSPKDISALCQLQAFERQMSCTKEDRGDSNVRYGWLGSRKSDIVRILINGFGTTGKPAEKACLNTGVYLSPEDRTFTSVGLCDVDEKGVQYMLLSRVILGNMEAITPGSQDCFPSSEIYDSGVDDCSNPKCYVVWPSHLSTHIRLKYLEFQTYPESSKITREEMVKKMIMIVGEKLLLETLKKLHYCPSLWHKSSIEVMSSDPAMLPSEDLARTIEEHISLDKPTRSCALTLGNLGDSKAPNAMAESSAALSSKGCDTLVVGTVPKSSDSLPPNGVPETSTSAGAVSQASPSVETRGSHSPMQILSPINSANHCAKRQDPFSPRMAPIVRDGLSKTASGNSASLGAEGCSYVAPSMRPRDYASLAPTNASKSRGIDAPGLGLKGSESLGPILALGNSICIGKKGPSSAPRMTPEEPEFLSLSISPQRPVLQPGKGHSDLMSGAAPPVNVPGIGNFPAFSTEICDSLALSIAPIGHDHPSSSINEPKCRGAPTTDRVQESQHSQAHSAATKGEGSTAPTPITVKWEHQAAQLGPHNKPSGSVLEPDSSVAVSTDIVLALPTPREMGDQ